MFGAVGLFALEVVVPRGRGPDLAVAIQPGQLDADLRGNGMFAIERLPFNAHPILVDGIELQFRDQRTALRKLHAVAAAVVREDLLVFRVIANALHQVVVINDQRRQAEFFGSKRRGRAERSSAGNQHVGNIDLCFRPQCLWDSNCHGDAPG